MKVSEARILVDEYRLDLEVAGLLGSNLTRSNAELENIQEAGITIQLYAWRKNLPQDEIRGITDEDIIYVMKHGE
jgi:hypothetical protein